jgi:prepilin-type N-terminal cleavage/methylation domain-containing protein
MKLQSSRLPAVPAHPPLVRLPACWMSPRPRPPRRTRRRGFTLLEFIVAMLLFAVAMSGMFPLVIMYSRMVQALEQRWNPVMGDWYLLSHPGASARFESLAGRRWDNANSNEWYAVPAPTRSDPGATEWVHRWYLEPSQDPWARKLGQSAAITSTDDGWPPAGQPQSLAPVTIHAGDPSPAYQETGDWDAQHQHAAAAGGSADAATWTFSVPAAGWYRVQATWTESAALAGDAGYTIVYDGPASPASATANQQAAPDLPPAAPADEGKPWHTLATAYFSRSGTSVSVSLQASASGPVVADGMRIVPCSVQVPLLKWTSGSPAVEEVTASVEIKP